MNYATSPQYSGAKDQHDSEVILYQVRNLIWLLVNGHWPGHLCGRCWNKWYISGVVVEVEAAKARGGFISLKLFKMIFIFNQVPSKCLNKYFLQADQHLRLHQRAVRTQGSQLSDYLHWDAQG